MTKSGESSKKLAALASKVLNDNRYSANAKSLAGSVLSQAPNKSTGGKKK
ncbi:hypothetical protein [Adhaeribacter soli]|nr:hypothetical protein [Adhaeribacter soli]